MKKQVMFMELTQAYVKALFDYREGALYWKVKPSPRIKAGTFAGSQFQNEPYRFRVVISGKSFLRARVIFLWHKGWLPEVVDHEDRNPINDRIDNLRPASNSQNMKNRRSAENSTSRYLGVSRIKEKVAREWLVSIKMNGTTKRIGVFHTEEEGALAYNKFAVKLHGEFANLNIIQP